MQIKTVSKDSAGSIVESSCYNNKEINKRSIVEILQEIETRTGINPNTHTTIITITHR